MRTGTVTATGAGTRVATTSATSSRERSRASDAALAACALVDAVWLIVGSVPGLTRWLALGLVVGLHGWCVVQQRRHPTVDARTVVWLCAGLAALAVALPVHGSKDVWSYAMTGRIMVAHHADAYVRPPSDFPHDPLYAHVSRTWRHTPDAYGPAFGAIAWLGAHATGGSALLARLWYQAIAAAALVTGVALLGRRGTEPWMLILLGLAPATLATVNGAHIDVLVGLGALVALVLVRAGRMVAAGVAVGLAVLVKFNVLPVAFGAALALLVGCRWRDALRLLGSCAGVAVAGYLAAGAAAFGQLRAESGFTSRTAIVPGLGQLLRQQVGEVPHLLTDPQLRSLVSATLLAAAMAVLAVRHRRAPDPVTFGVAALLAYVASANYALAWYPCLAILALGLVGPRLAGIGLAMAVLFQAAFVAPVKADLARVPAPWLVATWSPLAAAVLLAAIAWLPRPRGSQGIAGRRRLPGPHR